MSDHIHQWETYAVVGEPGMTRHRVCTICGIEETYTIMEKIFTTVDKADLEQLEQQLAEARAKIARQEDEIRILAAQRQDKQAQLAEARALLEEAMHVIVGAADPPIANEIARFEFWRIWSEKVRAMLLPKIGG